MPVKSFPANAWGLHDMHGMSGSGAEIIGAYPSSDATDPEGSKNGLDKVLRGGSWYSNAAASRSAYRNRDNPSGSSKVIGFRLVLEIKGEEHEKERSRQAMARPLGCGFFLNG